MKALVFIISLNLVFSFHLFSQNDRNNLIYIDKEGVVRYSNSNKEAAFFGVNYTVPFAYGYRSHKAMGVDLEKAIQQDVYHMSRLGLDAFRVHMWDVELSDSLGNVLDNEHLKLFDFLIAELKKKNIRSRCCEIFTSFTVAVRIRHSKKFSRLPSKTRISSTN